MGEGRVPLPGYRFSLKMAIYGWCGLAFSLLAVACLVFWLASIIDSRVRIDGIVIAGADIVASDGFICLRRPNVTCITIEQFDQRVSRSRVAVPSHRHVYGFDLPRIGFRFESYENICQAWLLDVSALIPCVAIALAAGFCLYRYRAVRRCTSLADSKKIGE